MVDVLLQSSDVLRAQLAFYGGAPGATAVSIDAMCAQIRTCQAGEEPGTGGAAGHAGTHAQGGAAMPPAAAPAAVAAPAQPPSPRALSITVPAGKDAAPLPPDLIEQLRELGELTEVTPARGHAAGGKRGKRRMATCTYRLVTDTPPEVVITLFEFVMDSSNVKVEVEAPIVAGATAGTEASPADPAAAPAQPAAAAAAGPAASDPGYGFFQPLPAAATEAPPVAAREAQPARSPDRPASTDTSIRVSVEKVDQLINQVGELVITQAMLAQSVGRLDPVLHEKLLAGMADLERNTRDLQESVMSIRMLPIAFVFNRFPRLVRDLAAKLGKQVQLVTQGEGTELDKGLIERISDPLTHLVRNSIDHGIEVPDLREAAGKPAFGTITLRAAHQGGNILIEVSDDGAGLDRDRILAKARERGLAVHDGMADAEVWNLIFEPGFSTAQVVTDVSGRGVGMDVVRRNIGALGGSVEIESMHGIGTRMTVRLPLTLAIMDGMSVAVGSEVYILPLASIVESLQVAEGQVRSIAGQGLVIDVRSEYLPVLSMHELFVNGPSLGDRASGTMVIVETEGAKVALLVDELLGQHQVVVKSLEANYRKVHGISGATIMGDGRVALILDVATLTRMRRQGGR
jgi:two-component system chemotaxis sensor kinase CheA